MSKKMDTQQLLMPRYEVIADYPNSPFKVGQVITPTQAGGDGFIDMMYIKIESVVSANWGNPKQYPHLFRLMGWWEGLSENELPKYLERLYVYKVVEATSWLSDNALFFFEDDCDLTRNYIPSTKDKYEEYLKLKQ